MRSIPVTAGGVASDKHDAPHLIQADALRRRVVEEPCAGEWPEKVKFYFRLRGIED